MTSDMTSVGAKADTILPTELVEAARRVVDANRAIGRRIALAESCTGGLVAALLTDIPGSSSVFERAAKVSTSLTSAHHQSAWRATSRNMRGPPPPTISGSGASGSGDENAP